MLLLLPQAFSNSCSIFVDQQSGHDIKRMQCLAKFIYPSENLMKQVIQNQVSKLKFSKTLSYSTMSEDDKICDFVNYIEKLKNHERVGVPKNAGTDSDDGFDLGRMRRLLARLGNPHTHYKAIHVAGSKGKGSTVAFISNILQENGYYVGCYTSPHLLSIRERISFGNNEPVSAEVLMNVFNRFKDVIDRSVDLENGLLTFFEVFTALAFAVFSEVKVDIAIIEAGLGGARDATNVLCNTHLIASVITSIGEEHLEALGGSLESIAIAKAGILKFNTPLVIGGPFESHIESIIRKKATTLNCPVVSACDPGIKSDVKGIGQGLDKPHQICDISIQIHNDLKKSIELRNVKLRMLGKHQLQNAITAVCTAFFVHNQGFTILDETIRVGIEKTQLTGRSQFLTHKEAEVVGISGSSLLIDGAHTEASAKGLSEVIKMTNLDGSIAIVVAMASDKDQTAFARQLLAGPTPKIVLFTEVSIAGSKTRSTPASALKDIWMRVSKEFGLEVEDLGTIEQEKNVGKEQSNTYLLESSGKKPILYAACQKLTIYEALRTADQFLTINGRESYNSNLVVVTGSLHIVSTVLAGLRNRTEHHPLVPHLQ